MNVVITGGGHSIGRGIVEKFAAEQHNVIFTYLNSEKQAKDLEQSLQKQYPAIKIKATQLNITDPDRVDEWAHNIIDEFERVDVLVNNAALLRNNMAIFMTNDEWNDVIATNLSGPFYMIRAFLTPMISHKFGRIINISSLANKGSKGQVNYAASKAGLVGLTRTIAMEYGPKGINCNSISLGLIDTGMVKLHMSEELYKLWHDFCPKRRSGTIEEVAQVIYFLSNESAAFINGETIELCGGLNYVP